MEHSTSTACLLENHEQEYAIISADITSKIGKLSTCSNDNRQQLSTEVEKLIEDGRELMEQMELEVRDVNPTLRSKYMHRISSYKAELTRLSQDFCRIRNKVTNNFSSTAEGFYAEYSDLNSEQKQRLLDATEQIEETGKHLSQGYRIAIETEELGSKMLQDLYAQRETIQSSQNRMHETNSNIHTSSQILSRMVNRSIQHRLLVGGVFAMLLFVAVITIYFKI